MDVNFKSELSAFFNQHGIDTFTNTPDFILADLVTAFIRDYADNMGRRDAWLGIHKQNNNVRH